MRIKDYINYSHQIVFSQDISSLALSILNILIND